MPRGSTEMGRRGGIRVGGQGTARLRGPPGLAGPVSGSRAVPSSPWLCRAPLASERAKGAAANQTADTGGRFPAPAAHGPPRGMCGFRADPHPPPGPCRPPGWQQPPPLHPRLRFRLSAGIPPPDPVPPLQLARTPRATRWPEGTGGGTKWQPARGPGSATVCNGTALGRPKPQAFIEWQLDAEHAEGGRPGSKRCAGPEGQRGPVVPEPPRTFTPSPRRLGGAPLPPPPPTLPQLFGAPAGCLVELLAGAWGGVLGVGVVIVPPTQPIDGPGGNDFPGDLTCGWRSGATRLCISGPPWGRAKRGCLGPKDPSSC